MSDATVGPEDHRVDPPPAAGELETLLAFLRYHRETLAWKTDGLDAADLSRPLPPSTMTLGGLLKHLALVEDDWFQRVLLGATLPEPWASADWDADRDWEWHSAAEDDPAALRALWRAAVDRSEAATHRVVAQGGLDALAVTPWRTGEHASLRWIIVHLIEEYARHNGHADLLREAVDGRTGE